MTVGLRRRCLGDAHIGPGQSWMSIEDRQSLRPVRSAFRDFTLVCADIRTRALGDVRHRSWTRRDHTETCRKPPGSGPGRRHTPGACRGGMSGLFERIRQVVTTVHIGCSRGGTTAGTLAPPTGQHCDQCAYPRTTAGSRPLNAGGLTNPVTRPARIGLFGRRPPTARERRRDDIPCRTHSIRQLSGR